MKKARSGFCRNWRIERADYRRTAAFGITARDAALQRYSPMYGRASESQSEHIKSSTIKALPDLFCVPKQEFHARWLSAHE